MDPVCRSLKKGLLNGTTTKICELGYCGKKSHHNFSHCGGQLLSYCGKEGIIGKKSKMSFWPSSNRPNDSAMELDIVQVGASMASGSLGRGGLVVEISLLGMGDIFWSFSAERVVPFLYRESSRAVKGGALSMGLSAYGGTSLSPCSDTLGPSAASSLCGCWLAIRARA